MSVLFLCCCGLARVSPRRPRVTDMWHSSQCHAKEDTVRWLSTISSFGMTTRKILRHVFVCEMPHVILPMCKPGEQMSCEELRCSRDARCTYDPRSGQPLCECNSGFMGDGYNCQPIGKSCDLDLRTHPRYYEDQTPCQILASYLKWFSRESALITDRQTRTQGHTDGTDFISL